MRHRGRSQRHDILLKKPPNTGNHHPLKLKGGEKPICYYINNIPINTKHNTNRMFTTKVLFLISFMFGASHQPFIIECNSSQNNICLLLYSFFFEFFSEGQEIF